MASIRIAGGVLDVVSVGAGPDVVLLHALLVDRSSFERAVPLLSSRYRLHLVALLGYDGSTLAGPDIESYADRVADGLSKLALRSGAALLGNGLGGVVAIALAARHAGMFGKLLLVDTAAAFPEAARETFGRIAEQVSSQGMAAIADAAASRIFHRAYLEAHPEAVGERRNVLQRFDPKAFVIACRAVQRVDLRPCLSRIDLPTLVIVGELDVATPVNLARELVDGLKSARLIRLPACGHCPPLEQPQPFVAAIAPFLEAAGTAEGDSPELHGVGKRS